MPRPLPPPAPRLTHDATQFVWGFELPAALLAPPALRAFRCHDCRGIASRAGGKQGLPGARRNRDRWLCFTIIVQNPHPPTISPTRFHTTLPAIMTTTRTSRCSVKCGNARFKHAHAMDALLVLLPAVHVAIGKWLNTRVPDPYMVRNRHC